MSEHGSELALSPRESAVVSVLRSRSKPMTAEKIHAAVEPWRADGVTREAVYGALNALFRKGIVGKNAETPCRWGVRRNYG